MPAKGKFNNQGNPAGPGPRGKSKPTRPGPATPPGPARRAAPPVYEPLEKVPGLLTSPDNDKVRFLRNLHNKKDRYISKYFLVEGVRLVEEALNAPKAPLHTLYDAEALSTTEAGQRLLMRLIEMLEDKKGVYPTTPQIMQLVSDTVSPQGVAAAVPFLNWTASQLAAARLHLVLDELQDPGNLGTILRSAGGAGDTAVWLTEGSVDYYSPKVVRAGMGAHFRVPGVLGLNWEDLTTRLKAIGVEQIFLADSPDAEATTTRPRKTARLPEVIYYEVDWSKPSAVIIGNEAHGATNQAWLAATHRLTIPMPGGAESLNAAVAASLVIFEALRQRTPHP